ncbi:hypothetical protein [Parafilimonas terrae]|uniref:DUF1735 domain-containing protein n=1 Tax=Parafilimonas terrae TaxID=1465490 RepID=A0A1I5WU12_9BACT|nr:hypothetical protein [Parafilimonas terrae]SFQ23275.1 hypothetical protein SAMN05444277_1076 [Parafilimonas terrae]
MKRTNIAACACMLLLLNSCMKETAETSQVSSRENSLTVVNGPVKMPRIEWASTTKTQFIANADGNGTAEFTLNFSAKKPGIQIQAFTFLAYETNENDALSIFTKDIPAFFSPTSYYGQAKAIATLNGTDIELPDDGSAVPVTFTIHYNVPSATGNVKSGDTVSVQLISIDFVNKTSPYILLQSLTSPLSPQMMITGAKPQLGLNIYDPDVLHLGLTRIMQFQYISKGGSLGINNLPLHINCSNARIRKELIVKDEYGQTINTTTVRDGDNYMIHFPEDYNLNGINTHTFYVYAKVYLMYGHASIRTKLQPSSAFSWTDIAGGQSMPFTNENAIYYRDYPKGLVTVTKNY